MARPRFFARDPIERYAWPMTRRCAVATVAWAAACVLLLPGCKEDTQLKVTGLHPTRGDYQGGQLVTVSGNRFLADGVRSIKVYFGGAQGKVQRIVSDDTFTVEAPGGKVNQTVDVKFFFEPGGVLTVQNAFTFIEVGDLKVEDLKMGGKK